MSNSKLGYFAYVGSRTSTERNARGEGISVYHVDRAKSKWTLIQIAKDLANPSFLAFDHQRKFLYTVHGDKSEVSAFRIDPRSGRLDFINTQSTKGIQPRPLDGRRIQQISCCCQLCHGHGYHLADRRRGRSW